MKVVITAGFDKALPAVALAELLQRTKQHKIEKIFVVTPFNVKRLRALMKQRGLSGVKSGVKRLFSSTVSDVKKNPLQDFLTQHEIAEKSLKKWAEKNNCQYQVVASLNDEQVCVDLAAMNIDAVLYAGGGILKESFINAVNGKILNAHSGPLPGIRGMNACEWSLLLGFEPTVTIHFIDKGIDTGKIIADIPIIQEPDDDIDTLRAKCVVAGVDKMLTVMKAEMMSDIELNVSSAVVQSDSVISRQCFVLAPVLKELLAYKLDKAN